MTDDERVKLLATRVMGWVKGPDPNDSAIRYWWKGSQYQAPGDWNPLVNIADAVMLLPKMEALGMDWSISGGPRLKRHVSFWKDDINFEGEAIEESLSRAIGIATLEALWLEGE